jgi:hypothetical protein
MSSLRIITVTWTALAPPSSFSASARLSARARRIGPWGDLDPCLSRARGATELLDAGRSGHAGADRVRDQGRSARVRVGGHRGGAIEQRSAVEDGAEDRIEVHGVETHQQPVCHARSVAPARCLGEDL